MDSYIFDKQNVFALWIKEFYPSIQPWELKEFIQTW